MNRRTFKKLVKSEGGLVVSEATLRESDLIESFISVLDQFHGFKALVNEGEFWLKRLKSKIPLSDAELDSIGWYLNEELFNAMDTLSPNGFYFGASEGDGACFGYWLAEDEYSESGY